MYCNFDLEVLIALQKHPAFAHTVESHTTEQGLSARCVHNPSTGYNYQVHNEVFYC